MPRIPSRSASTFSFLGGGGGRVPPVVGLLIAATFIASIVGALGMHSGFPLVAWAALVPSAVLHGQVWRLVTWVFFELSPFSLIFGCLMFYWFGRDLAYRWGPLRFVLYYLAGAAVIGGLVVALSRVYAPVGEMVYTGTWPIQEGIIILWAAYYPARQMNIYFVLPLGGRNLILFTIAGTVLLAIYSGLLAFVPHFIAIALALAWLWLPSPRALWIEARLRGMEKKRRATHLKAVPRDADPSDRDPPGGRWLN